MNTKRHIDVSSQLLWWLVEDSDFFNIMTEDESWFLHFDQQTKMMEHGMASHDISQKEGQHSYRNCCLGSWLVEFLLKETISVVYCSQAQKKLQCALFEKCLTNSHPSALQHTTSQCIYYNRDNLQRLAGKCSHIQHTVQTWSSQIATISGVLKDHERSVLGEQWHSPGTHA